MRLHVLATRHARARSRLAKRIRAEFRRLWRLVDPRRISESWTLQVPRLLAVLTGAQLQAAETADPYVAGIMAAHGMTSAPSGLVVPSAYAGVASDGRPLASLLTQPATVAKVALAEGRSLAEAMATGQALAEMIGHTQVTDAGRVADQAALVTRETAVGYVRMIVGYTCSRCIILAGTTYRWNAGFKRHPLCDCVHIPIAEATDDDVRLDPKKIFESMSAEQQDKVFTQAGAQAIRDGADMAKVVNARRRAAGLTPAGGRGVRPEDGRQRGRLQRVNVSGRDLFVTSEGSRRGRARLMPESIYELADGDRDEAIRLLKHHGYVLGRSTALQTRPAPAPTYDQRVQAAANGQAALDAPQLGVSRRPRPEEHADSLRAVNTYTGAEYAAINRHLRGQRLPYGYEPDDVTPIIARMDQAMAASTLAVDIAVHRGVLDASVMFGDRLDRDLTGLEWSEQAYLSTTANAASAAGFARGGETPVVMRILVPAGTPAVEASDMRLEAEVLITRGQRLRVVADRGRDPQGVRHIDVEVVPGG